MSEAFPHDLRVDARLQQVGRVRVSQVVQPDVRELLRRVELLLSCADRRLMNVAELRCTIRVQRLAVTSFLYPVNAVGFKESLTSGSQRFTRNSAAVVVVGSMEFG